MHVAIGVVLALSLAARYDGTNGLDPEGIRVLAGPGPIVELDEVASADFLLWLQQGSPAEVEARANAVKYFVACAFDPSFRLRVKGWEWDGHFALAPKTAAKILTYVRTSPAASPAPGKGAPAPIPPRKPKAQRSLRLITDEGKWVSACVLAHVNMAGTHQYVSLRGAHSGLERWVTKGTAWAQGHPEGVFLADVLNYVPTPQEPAPTRKYLERSFTLSLNLPDVYPPSPAWLPPNVALGRTLTFEPSTFVAMPGSATERYRVARRLGPWTSRPDKLPGEPYAKPLFPANVCLVPGDSPQLVPCKSVNPAVEAWHPIAVFLPHFIRLADPTKPSPMNVVEATFTGTIDPARHLETCDPAICIGPHAWVTATSAPKDPPAPPAPQVLKGVRSGEIITATLRYVKGNSGGAGPPDMKEKFTAIVRYRSKMRPEATIEVQRENGGWQPVTTGEWPPSGDFEWLQVYPVVPVMEDLGGTKQPVLRIRISGTGDGSQAPVLDVVGFVAGRPRCVTGNRLSMRVCDRDMSPDDPTHAQASCP